MTLSGGGRWSNPTAPAQVFWICPDSYPQDLAVFMFAVRLVFLKINTMLSAF